MTTPAQDEDRAACLEMGLAWAKEHHPEWGALPDNPQFAEHARDLSSGMIFAFDAGMKREQGRRGCCHFCEDDEHDG